MEQRHFNVEEILFEKYKEIMTKFLVEDFDSPGGNGWIKKVNKFDEDSGAEDVSPEPLDGDFDNLEDKNSIPSGVPNDGFFNNFKA